MSKLKKALRRTPVVGKRVTKYRDLVHDNGILRLEKDQLEATLREKDTINFSTKRNFLAQQYLSGKGIEIGAAHLPIKLPKSAKVKYVDVFSTEDLRKVFPQEYKTAPLVEVDVVDDGETLSKFKDDSLDFIIANHFIEHCLDPIGTIINMYKKLRKEGVLYMAIPNKQYTFDKPRDITPYEHLLEEHKDKSKSKFRKAHTEEAVRLTIDELRPSDIPSKVQEILDSGFRIHYHVWGQPGMTELFVRLAQDFKINLEIDALMKNEHEVIYVLRKEPPLKLQTTS
jgi:SAM-dependent methyltransferase